MTALLIVLSLMLGVAVAVGAAIVLRCRRARRIIAGLLRERSPGSASSTLEECLTKLGRLLADLEAENSEGKVVANRLEEVLGRMVQGVAICDKEGNVVFRKYQASLEGSLHGQVLVDAAVNRVLKQAMESDSAADSIDCDGGAAPREELRLYGPPERLLLIRSHALEGGVAGLVEDITDKDRVETLRRDFVGNISHELRTPVGAISLLAETIAQEDDKDAVEVLSRRMISEADRMTRLVDDLTELARVQNDPEGECSALALGEVALEIAERLAGAAEQRGVTVNVSVPESPVFIYADRRQIASAVHNLLDNALKYSSRNGAVSIRVRVLGGLAELEVQDTGIGIPRKAQERIFERFFRVDRSRTEKSGGTGLGLAIVRHVAINHGGEVSVTSLEGEGSTFTLRLPLLEDAGCSGDAPANPSRELMFKPS